MNRSMTAAGCAALCLLIAHPAMAACALKTQPIPVKMTSGFPMINTGGPTVDVKVNGKAAHFVLNSSSAVNEISTKFASGQKLAATKTSNADIYTAPKFELAGASMDNAQFIGSAQLGDADGAIGQTILGLMDVEYDLAGGKVILAKADGCEKSNMAYWAKDNDLISEMPLVTSSNGIPVTETAILVNGVQLRAVFDTAAPFSVITESAAEKAGVKTSDASVKPMRRTSGKWLGSFTVNVGGEEMKNAPLEIRQVKDADYDVLIGADYFLTHHLYVANSQKKIFATRAGVANAPMFAAHQPPDLAPGEASSRALGGLGAGS